MDNELTYQESDKNYNKYKDEIEYDILIENDHLIFGEKRIERLTKKVYDELYDQHLISKEYYTKKIDSLNLKKDIKYNLIGICLLYVIIYYSIIHFY